MSKPATHSSTAPPSTRAGNKSAGLHRPICAANRDPGRHRRQHQRRAEPKMRQRRESLGEAVAQQKQQHRQRQYSGNRFGRNNSVAATKAHEHRQREQRHARRLNNPAGICRSRGARIARRRSARSASRLKAIAALRAGDHAQQDADQLVSSATRTGGVLRAPALHAITAANSANGSANSVWLKRIISRIVAQAGAALID